MKAIEMFAPEMNEPILCKDGKLGIVIRNYPDSEDIGVQVPNEEAIRWIKKHELERLWKEPPEKGELYQVISRSTIHLPYLCGLDDEEWEGRKKNE
jgi:hypothetical protein